MIRQAVRQSPPMGPYLRIASMPYWLQLGVKRQHGPINGLIPIWYTRIRRIMALAMTRFTMFDSLHSRYLKDAICNGWFVHNQQTSNSPSPLYDLQVQEPAPLQIRRMPQTTKVFVW